MFDIVTYMFAGSRTFDTPAGYHLVRVLAHLAAQGSAFWHVGDASGADTEFIVTFLANSPQPHRLSVFSVEKKEDARFLVQRADRAGANVVYPPESVLIAPFRARLAIRSRIASEGTLGGWFVADKPDSAGTFKSASLCAKAGGRVRVFPLFPVEALPPLDTGSTGFWEDNELFGVPYALWVPGLPF